MDFMKGIGYSLRDYQVQIINDIQENIASGRRMQTILLPNAGGKTTLSYILSIMFTERGKRVLYFTSEGSDKWYASHAIRTEIERFSKVDFGDTRNIKKLCDNHYDIVITDAIYWMFSSDVLEDFNSKIKEADVRELEARDENLSTAQQSLIGLHYLQEMIERDNSFVISFDLDKIEDIGYAPIISAPHVLTFKMSREQQIEYGYACADEYENISKKKMQVIEEQGAAGPDVKKYDSALDLILEKLDGGFSILGAKIDNLQNDVTQILSVVNELNETVNANKGVLGLYFSVHDEDDLESDLFVSKLVEKMTSEMLGKISKFESQEKYQKILKLVMVRLGEDAWNKLDLESQKFLVTAKFMFMENMNLAEEIDYSSICLLSSKAFEVELAKRLVTEYEAYLISKKIPESKWPKGLLVFNKRKGSYERMKVEDFTLGSCPYIMGVLGNEAERKINRQSFEMYCKDQLMKKISSNEMTSKIREFDGYIRCVKDNYRNPAAHKTTMSMSEASECLDYILEIERVLKIMLEQFAF